MAKWLPDREQDFKDLCERWIAEFNKPGRTEYGWDENLEKGTMSAINVFLRALDAYKEDDSTTKLIAKNDAKINAKSSMRAFANSSIRFNDKMRPENKEPFNIRERDRVLSPTPELNSFPEAESISSIPRQIGINFWDSVTKKRAKPHGVHGAEIRWAVLDAAPRSVKELVNSDFSTVTPFTLKFDDSQRGKRVYFCLRWETNSNVKGPFGEIMSAIIP